MGVRGVGGDGAEVTERVTSGDGHPGGSWRTDCVVEEKVEVWALVGRAWKEAFVVWKK